ncbi:hypothetical protein BH18VER1_BH18VER1_14100 [soil metagenome]
MDDHTERLQGSLPAPARHWGIARKALNIFLRDALYTTYLNERFGLRQAEPFFEVPLDMLTATEIKRASGRASLPAWPGVKHILPPLSQPVPKRCRCAGKAQRRRSCALGCRLVVSRERRAEVNISDMSRAAEQVTIGENSEFRRIDRSGEVIEIRFGDAGGGGYDTWIPVALVEPSRNGKIGVELLLHREAKGYKKILGLLSEELTFYFTTKQESDPWTYARYHCTTAANIYSPLHWSFFPPGHNKA